MSGTVPRSRNPIAGAPFAQWTIDHAAPLPGWPARTTTYPEEGDAGYSYTFVGDAVLDPAKQRIHIRLVRGNTWSDAHAITDRYHELRDSGDFGTGLTPETITELVEVPGAFGVREAVVRCLVPGCDDYKKWHLENARLPHHAEDHSVEDAYTCRLTYVDGRWEPEIEVHSRLRKPTMNSAIAAGLASDIQWVITEARILNDSRRARQVA